MTIFGTLRKMLDIINEDPVEKPTGKDPIIPTPHRRIHDDNTNELEPDNSKFWDMLIDD